MKLQYGKSWVAALGTGVLVTVAMLPQARGSLVFEDDLQNNSSVRAKAEDRGLTRKVIDISQDSRGVRRAEAAGLGEQLAPRPQPIEEESVSSEEISSMPRAELLRRERLRQENANEDRLKERLEALRLRKEQALTQRILEENAASSDEIRVRQAKAMDAGLQEEAVVAPITERPGQPLANVPQTGQVRTASLTEPVLQGQNTMTLSGEPALDGEKTSFIISPRIGVASMSGVNSVFDVRAHFSLGLGLGVTVTDNLTLEGAYSFNEYGVALSSQGMSPYNMYGMQTPEALTLKQNVFEAGMKLHFLGKDSRARPFITGGAGYSKSYLNYSSTFLSMMRTYSGSTPTDYESTQFLGVLGAGLDVTVSKSISVGAAVKYYSVLSSNQGSNLYYQSFLAQPVDPVKMQAGSTLNQNGFWSITAGLNFSM